MLKDKRKYTLSYKCSKSSVAELIRAVIAFHGGKVGDVEWLGYYAGVDIYSIASAFLYKSNRDEALKVIDRRFYGL